MKIKNYISLFLKKGAAKVRKHLRLGYTGDAFSCTCEPFADAIYLNAVELITDLCHDVVFPEYTQRNIDKNLYIAYRRFYQLHAQTLLNTIYKHGYAVVCVSQSGEGMTAAYNLTIGEQNRDYTRNEDGDYVVFSPMRDGVRLYVVKSTTFVTTGKSDYAILLPWLNFLDDVANGSSTITRRLGSMLIISPKTGASMATAANLDDDERKEIEDEFGKSYGTLANQHQVAVFRSEVNAQVVNMAGLDQRFAEKLRACVCVIADRLKVPANQIAMIDAMSSKTLANGTELREGDFNKYQTFERVLDATFLQLGRDLGFGVDFGNNEMDYTIYNKPTRNTNEGI